MDVKELIFNMYKDQVVVAQELRKKFMKKFNLTVKEISDICARITNYQIKKYGSRLDNDKELHTKETSKYVQRVARTRKYQKKYKYWENTEVNRKANYL